MVQIASIRWPRGVGRRERPSTWAPGLVTSLAIGMVCTTLYILRQNSFGPYYAPLASRVSTDKLSSSRLALDHSLGFFDDLSDKQWRRMQRNHASIFPNHFGDLMKYSNTIRDRGKREALRNSNWWWGDNFHAEFHCPLMLRLPTTGQADGPKWVCDPHRLLQREHCLIYSIGSNGKAEFEQGIHDVVGDHCEIHTFDPIGYNKRNGNFSMALEGLATFHQYGYGTTEDTKKHGYKTLSQIMDDLGHTGRTIDIFKIDCEWCEWHTYPQWLKGVDIRQILVETHNAPMPEAKKFFYELHDAGFVIFSKEANYQNAAGAVEYGFVKLLPDFFRFNDSTYMYSTLDG